MSIVTYASGTEVVLDSTPASEKNKKKIISKINKLTARGSTNGSGGLELAYAQAADHFIAGGNNRVIMMSDGDFNVGISDGTPLKEFIQDKAQRGVYLTVLGYGMGNMRDDNLESLARNGNGNYAYIDSAEEAEKLFVKDIAGMLGRRGERRESWRYVHGKRGKIPSDRLRYETYFRGRFQQPGKGRGRNRFQPDGNHSI